MTTTLLLWWGAGQPPVYTARALVSLPVVADGFTVAAFPAIVDGRVVGPAARLARARGFDRRTLDRSVRVRASASRPDLVVVEAEGGSATASRDLANVVAASVGEAYLDWAGRGLRAEVDALTARADALERRVAGLPAGDRSTEVLLRSHAAHDDRISGLEVALAGLTAVGPEVVSEAETPTTVRHPLGWPTIVAVLVGTALAGSCVAVALHRTTRRIRSVADVPARPGLHALAEVEGGAALSTDLVGARAVARSLEASGLSSLTGPDAPSVVVVVEHRSMEGAGSVASGLALALAGGGRVVTLVDAQLSGEVAHALGGTGSGGLRDVLAGEAELQDVVVRLEDLWLLPAGRSTVPFLGRQRRLAAVLGAVERTSDVVVVRGPVMGTADWSSVAALVDQVVLVIASGAVRRPALRELVASGALGRADVSLVLVEASRRAGGVRRGSRRRRVLPRWTGGPVTSAHVPS